MTVKSIWLIRHAKAKSRGSPDHARELAHRGYRQCVEMGNALTAAESPPELFLTSDARRALTTAHVLNGFVGGRVREVSAMYTFSVETLWRVAREAMESSSLQSAPSLALVGHNGAISDLGVELTGDYNAGSLPTLGMVELTFDGAWTELFANARVKLQQRIEPNS